MNAMQIKRNVMLSIQGTQSDAGELVDETRLVTQGKLTVTDGVPCLSYTQRDEDNKPYSTTIEMRDGIVSVNRVGTLSTSFAFKKGCQCRSLFTTPFGEISMDAFPTDVAFVVEEERGSVDLCYQLSLEGQYVGTNAIRIDFWNHD